MFTFVFIPPVYPFPRLSFLTNYFDTMHLGFSLFVRCISCRALYLFTEHGKTDVICCFDKGEMARYTKLLSGPGQNRDTTLADLISFSLLTSKSQRRNHESCSFYLSRHLSVCEIV